MGKFMTKLKSTYQGLTNVEQIVLTFVVAVLPPVIAYVSDPNEPVRTLVGAVLSAVLVTALKYLGQPTQ